MIKPTLKWDDNDGTGSVVFPKEFDEQDWVMKADALQDWIADLTSKYNSLLHAWVNREVRKHHDSNRP